MEIEHWRTMENAISEARACFADSLRRAEAGDEVLLLPVGGTAKMAQIARPTFSFP
jgi:antitoxin (DNA-binding transcriptional repressor) of toxin-antitoxin stability system